jgi:hypothetical protein
MMKATFFPLLCLGLSATGYADNPRAKAEDFKLSLAATLRGADLEVCYGLKSHAYKGTIVIPSMGTGHINPQVRVFDLSRTNPYTGDVIELFPQVRVRVGVLPGQTVVLADFTLSHCAKYFHTGKGEVVLQARFTSMIKDDLSNLSDDFLGPGRVDWIRARQFYILTDAVTVLSDPCRVNLATGEVSCGPQHYPPGTAPSAAPAEPAASPEPQPEPAPASQ